MLEHQYLQMFAPNIRSNFHPLEVVGRGSETQLRVGENVLYRALRVNILTRIKS